MDTALTWFIRIWTGLFAIAFALSVGFVFVTEGSWVGLAKLQKWLSPFNLASLIVNAVLLSPALAAYWWRERRREKQKPRSKESDRGPGAGKERF